MKKQVENKTQWQYMKRKLIDGLDCVLCGKPAQTLHHPQKGYGSRLEYFNAENQIPICHDCHWSKVHILGKVNPETGWQKCMGGGFDE